MTDRKDKEGSRIIQGGELGIEAGSLDEVVSQAAGTIQPASGTALPGGLPPADMSLLNQSLVHFLQNVGTTLDGHDVTVKTLIQDQSVLNAVSMVGHVYFSLHNLHYVKDFWNMPLLKGTLTHSPSIPLPVFKQCLSSFIGDDLVDYFLSEFGDRCGLEDETKPVDIANPAYQKYLPMVAALSALSGEYFIMKNPYLLLLNLDQEEREAFTFFFSEAQQARVHPFKGWKPIVPTFDQKIDDYGCTQSYIVDAFTHEPHILPFTELLRIGKKYGIGNIAQYAEKLEQFRERIANIPGA